RALSVPAASAGVELVVELPAEPVIVVGDPEALQQGVSNLIDNAVKYSQAETIAVRVTATNSDAFIEVEDDGLGIEARHHERIFERFYRVDKARSRELGGTGLGLAIVKHIALAHSGRVCLESQAGQGSTFQLRLPLAPSLTGEPQTLGSESVPTPIS
ncbi:MAG: ATP-binding protein, partial [Acidobacteriota bacterium]